MIEIPSDLHLDILSSLNHKIRSTYEKRPHMKTTILNSVIENNDPSTNKSKYLNIRISSHSDGQEAIIKYTRYLQHQKETGNISEESLTTDAIAKQLDTIYGPAPDLILIFGDRCCLDGYPPWHIKYAEMK